MVVPRRLACPRLLGPPAATVIELFQTPTRSSPWLCASALRTRRSTTCSPSRPATSSTGAALLAEMLGDGADREDIAQRMREAEHAADETTHAIVRRVNSTFVTPVRPRGHLRARLRASTTSWTSWRRPSTCRSSTRSASCPTSWPNQVEVHPALRRADGRGDAAAADDGRPRGVLDRDQPAREPRRQELPPDPGQALQRPVRRARGAQAQGHRGLARGAPSTPSRRSRTSSSRSRSRSPEGGARDRHRGRRRRARIRLHQRLPRRRQRHRHVDLDAGADAADRADDGRGDELRRRLPRPEGRPDGQRGDRPAGRPRRRPGGRARRPARRDRLEPRSPGTSGCRPRRRTR